MLNHTFIRKSTSLLSLAISSAGITLAPAPAQAQQLVLEEVIVTAQKREESVQDVPMTVNALAGDALEDLNLFNFGELQLVTPGLDMRAIDGRAGSISLRGVDYNPNSAAAQAVDVYWNGVTLGRNASGGVFQQMFDLARVEVLRGPQGTLQGRTSPAGAIAIHTRMPDPNEDMAGHVRATFTDNDGINTQGAVSLPLIDGVLAARIAGVYDESDLNEAENVLSGDVSNSETYASRISLRWYPTENLSADLAWQYLDNDLDNNITLDGSSTLDQGLPDISADDREGINPQVDAYEADFNYVSLNLSWEVAGHDLVYVGGYSDLDSTRDFDLSGNSKVGFDPVDITAIYPQVGAARSQLNNPAKMLDDNEAWSHELRLSSLDNEFFNYTVGLYYGEESGNFNQTTFRALPAGGGNQVFFNTIVKTPFDLEDYGVFAHTRFDLTNAWSLQLGARWQENQRDTQSVAFAAEDVDSPLFTLQEGDELLVLIEKDLQEDTSDAVTGSATLQYAFEQIDAVGYLSVGTSWRPGGVSISVNDLGEYKEFDEEDSISYELGIKSKLLDDRLRFNAAVFYQEFDDYIGRLPRIPINRNGIPRPDGTPSGNASLTFNGDATVTGIEMDFDYLATLNWRLGGGLSYVEAEYDNGEQIPCVDGNIPAGELLNTCDAGGEPLGNQPKFSVRLHTDYAIPFERFEGYVRGLYQYDGDRDDVDAPGGELDSFSVFDLHLGLRDPEGRWDVSVFARNLFDEDSLTSVQPEFRTRTGQGTGYLRAQVVQPQRFGLSASYNF
jgi:iron complex outermembrane receptor protein